MSTMKELYLKVAADAGLQEKVDKIFETAGEDVEALKAGLLEFAKELGFEVTVEEISEFFGAMSEPSGDQLSEEELDAVAGGKGHSGGSKLSISVTKTCNVVPHSWNCRIF